MPSIASALSNIVALFIVTALGYVAAKLGYLNKKNQSAISKLILNITLPCTIVSSVVNIDASGSMNQIGEAFVLAAVAFPAMFVAGAACVFVLRVPKGQRCLYLFMSMFTNTGFIGIAVVSSVYGGTAALLGSIITSVINVFFFSIGIRVLTGGDKFDVKAIVNAPLVASVVAMALLFSDLKLPDGISLAVSMAGGITAPLAMMLVGLSIAEADFSSIVSEYRLYGFTAVRFLAFPALAFFAARALITDPAVVGVFVLMLAMPVGSMASAMASAWGRDPILPAKGTVITTLASFLTIPALLALMIV